MGKPGQCMTGYSWSRFACFAAVLALLFACSDTSEEGPAPAQDPNAENRVGSGFATIQSPTSMSTFSTVQSFITLSGDAFISPGNSIPDRETGVSVTWSSSTGASGTTLQFVRLCSIFGAPLLCDHTWSTTISLSLGINTIRVRASDSQGNSGSDGITVTRLPESDPPTVSSTTPANLATNVLVNHSVSVTFSEEMDNATINAATFTVRDSGGNPVAGTVSIFNRTATFQPSSFLSAFAVHSVTLSQSVKDVSGNGLEAPFTWTFTTGSADVTPPTIVSVSPAPGSSCTPIDANIVVNFSEAIDPLTLSIGSFTARQEAPCCPGVSNVLRVSSNGASAVLDPTFPLSFSTSYSATVFPQIKDLGGNPAPFFTWTFSTPASGVGTWQSISVTGAPQSAVAASTVWTGANMIVFGGSAGSGPTNVGARYEPAANTWTSLPAGPAARQRHVAVWTGSEMIIWGGDGTVGSLNDGARFNPATNTWTPISAVGAPSARSSARAVWTGSEMLVWGGSGSGGLSTDHGAYNPATDSWRPLSSIGAPSPNQRLRHTAVWTGNRMIVWGGDTDCFSTSCPATSGGAYDPLTDTWHALATAGEPSRRTEHSAVWTGTEMAIWAGRTIEASSQTLNTGALYNPSTSTWRTISTSCAAADRSGHFAAWTGSELLIWGGNRNTGARYNPATSTWQHMKSAPLGSVFGANTVWTGSQMLVWGGIAGGATAGALFTP